MSGIYAKLMRGSEGITNSKDFATIRMATLNAAFEKILELGLRKTLTWQRFGDGLAYEDMAYAELDVQAADDTSFRTVAVLTKVSQPGGFVLRMQEHLQTNSDNPTMSVSYPRTAYNDKLWTLATNVFGE